VIYTPYVQVHDSIRLVLYNRTCRSGTFPKCEPGLVNCSILGPFFWEQTWSFSLHPRGTKVERGGMCTAMYTLPFNVSSVVCFCMFGCKLAVKWSGACGRRSVYFSIWCFKLWFCFCMLGSKCKVEREREREIDYMTTFATYQIPNVELFLGLGVQNGSMVNPK
jgi:hypothetical protein